MKTKPIIFNAQMVKALIDGDKIVTRRPVSPKPEPSGLGYDWWPSNRLESMVQVSGFKEIGCDYKRDFIKETVKDACPIAQVGDLLYVRETFRFFNSSDECSCSDYCNCPTDGTPLYFATHNDCESKWKPSIHMPRKFSRLTLKVTDVRIEKLNDLRKNEEQIKKEGFESWPRFKHVWEGIYGQSKPNDYVWVIEFDVINQNIDDYIKSLPSK
ncbi:hypothetical protein ERJ77_01790 [Vibrio anguillarum]|uniref:ASCH domain-containing protein n=1 Tax=Vibrio anguillarum TaxID=55601 RepID=A0AAW4B949_VIBAN|nr:hypothetical protein [Vibrio anguillarum]